MRKLMIQDHALLARRLYRMANALMASNNGKPSDEQKAAARSLEAAADEHHSKAMLFGASFVMVLR